MYLLPNGVDICINFAL